MTDIERKDLVDYRLSKSKDILKEVDILVENRLWNTAINRLYYASYYAASALLLMNNISVQTHAGVRQMLGLHFVKTGRLGIDYGRFFNDIFDKRQSGDYADFIDFSEQDVVDIFKYSKEFIEEIERLIFCQTNIG